MRPKRTAEKLPLPPLLFRRLARSIPCVACRLLFSQCGRLALGSLGCGPSRHFRGFPFSLRGKLGGAVRLFGQLGLMRSLRGLPVGGASGSFCEHGFSCRPTLRYRRIVRPGPRAEFLQHRLFRLRGVVLPLAKIRDHVRFHLVSSCSGNACSPADDHALDALARFHILPITATPTTEEGNHVRADVIFTKKLEWPVRWWLAFVNESIHALLPRCHPLCWSPIRRPFLK
jgi:hypothetical protein